MDAYPLAFFALGIGVGLCAGYMIGRVCGFRHERELPPAQKIEPTLDASVELPPAPEKPDWGDDWFGNGEAYTPPAASRTYKPY